MWNVTDKQMRQCLKFHKWKGKISDVRPLPKGGAKCIFPKDGSVYFLVFSENNLPCIVHEAAHIVAKEMNRRDIGNDSWAGDEANAYMLEWLVCQLVNKMKPKILCSQSPSP